MCAEREDIGFCAGFWFMLIGSEISAIVTINQDWKALQQKCSSSYSGCDSISLLNRLWDDSIPNLKAKNLKNLVSLLEAALAPIRIELWTDTEIWWKLLLRSCTKRFSKI